VTGILSDQRAFGGTAVLRLPGVALLAIALLPACEPTPRVGAPQPAGDASSFGVISEQILLPRCATGGCHGGNPPANFPALEPDLAHAAIVGVESTLPGLLLVVEGDPAASYLVQRMQADMPPGDPLDPSDLAAIEAWIANGALND
jgi:hypothetical protein